MEKEIIIDVQGVTSSKVADESIAVLTTTYDIGNRKCIVERHFKATGNLSIDKILKKLIESDFTKH